MIAIWGMVVPTFWPDKVCIDQCNADGLRNVMACRRVLVLCCITCSTLVYLGTFHILGISFARIGLCLFMLLRYDVLTLWHCLCLRSITLDVGQAQGSQ